MKSIFRDGRFGRLAGSLPVVLMLLVAMTAGALSVCGQSAPASSPSGGLTLASSLPATTPSSAPLALRDKAVEQILHGRFDDGYATLTKAVQSDPQDASSAKLLEWVDTYMKARAKAQTERETEYQAAAARIRRAMLAESHLASADKDAMEQVRSKSGSATEAFAKSPTSDALDEADAQKAQEQKTRSIEALANSLESIKEVVSLLQADDSEWGADTRSVVERLSGKLAQYAAVWESLDPQDDAARHLAAAQLRTVEDDVTDAMADLESLIVQEPWRVGLLHARLAKQVATEDDRLTEQTWYRQFIQDVENRGTQAVQMARWYDALSAYAALEDLDHDNDAYKQASKTVRSHVRMLRLYGLPASNEVAGTLGAMGLGRKSTSKPAATSAPSTQDAQDEDRPDWREMVTGIDADTARAAISRLNDNYVIAVDYKKVAHGALGAVKVLAETPQAADSFELLADESKRNEFVDVVERQIGYIDRQDYPDATALQLAFNAVLRASEQTVKIPVSVLAMEFTDGLLEELDKFSSMIWPNDVADFQKQTIGRFYGVGIQIAKEPGEPLKVVTPLPDSPAFKAGIKAGDLVLAVDGKQTDAYPVDKLVDMIMGEKGTKVMLTIKRRGLLEPLEIAIVRDEISILTVKGWRPLDEGSKWDYLIDPESKIAYVRVTQFTESTPMELDEVLRDLRRQGVNSLIMDLRFNPGGLLRSAAMMCDEFLRSGRIVYTQGRQTEKTELKASGPGKFLDGQLIILVNELSASAAEIVSGALKDWDRATIIGERSYGKGSVQQVIQIPNHKAYLKLTTAYYYVGRSGKLLHRSNGAKEWGVDPDVKVAMTPKQMERWLRIRRKTDLLLPDTPPQQLQEELRAQLEADVQLSTAVLVAKLRQIGTPESVAAK